MKTLSFFLSLFALTAQAGSPVIFEGNFARTLTDNISLNDKVYLLQGSLNPTSVAVAAPAGSVYLSTNGALYVKQDAGLTTNWVATAGGLPSTRTISTTAPLTGGGDLSADRTFAITQATTSTNGYLSSTDWNTFNGKQSALTIGNLTDAGTDGITVTGGTGAVIGSGASLSQHVADTTHAGYLSSTDWNTFNGKQATGNYLTALTSDVSASGPGSAAATVNTVGGSSASAINTATTLVNGAQSGNKVLISPANGTSAAPGFRALVGADLPNPSSSTLGGVQSIAAVSHNFLTAISISGVPSQAQPAFTDISGSVAATQLPNPSASTLGGIESIAAVSHNFLTAISTSGVPAQAQPAFSDISGNISTSQMNSGTGASSTTFFRGDGSWATPAAPTYTAPTITFHGSGSGTHTFTGSPLWVEIYGVGGGGGGGAATSGNGGTGGNTTINSTLLVANGGTGGQSANNNGGSGGSASFGAGVSGWTASGGGGQGGGIFGSGVSLGGGLGGASCWGGMGNSGAAAGGGNAATNTGGGGSGGSTSASGIGGGGGAGGCFHGFLSGTTLSGLSGSVSYAVGAAGTAGSGSGGAGGVGGSGGLLFIEHYQ